MGPVDANIFPQLTVELRWVAETWTRSPADEVATGPVCVQCVSFLVTLELPLEHLLLHLYQTSALSYICQRAMQIKNVNSKFPVFLITLI